jgi:hypothetical protein
MLRRSWTDIHSPRITGLIERDLSAIHALCVSGHPPPPNFNFSIPKTNLHEIYYAYVIDTDRVV